MQCHQFEQRLNELLDERQDPAGDRQLAAHAQHCQPCDGLLTGQAALLAGLRGIRTPPPSGGLAQAVLAEVIEPAELVGPAAGPKKIWWMLAGLAATAAALMLAVNVALVMRRDRDRQAQLVNQPQAPASHNDNVQPRPKSRGLAVATPRPIPKRAKPRGFATPGGQQRPGSGLSFANFGMSLEGMAANLPVAVEQLDEVERMAPGIRPIRVSFVMLLDALRWAIPGLHPQDGERTHPTSLLHDPWRVA